MRVNRRGSEILQVVLLPQAGVPGEAVTVIGPGGGEFVGHKLDLDEGFVRSRTGAGMTEWFVTRLR